MFQDFCLFWSDEEKELSDECTCHSHPQIMTLCASVTACIKILTSQTILFQSSKLCYVLNY
jgi:hypothetical protein